MGDREQLDADRGLGVWEDHPAECERLHPDRSSPPPTQQRRELAGVAAGDQGHVVERDLSRRFDRLGAVGPGEMELCARCAERRPCRQRVGDGRVLKVKNGRKNVKSALYRPILSANRRRQRPTAVYAHADPA